MARAIMVLVVFIAQIIHGPPSTVSYCTGNVCMARILMSSQRCDTCLQFVGVEMIYTTTLMDKDATMVSVSLQPSQGLTKRSVNLSAGSCHSDLASERVSRILNMNLKIEAE
jgi:hypothetical protein